MISDKTFELLDQLAEVEKGQGSRTAKMDILKQNKEHLVEFFDIAFNPYRVFKIQQIPEKPIELHKWIAYDLETLAQHLEGKKGLTNLDKDAVAASMVYIEETMGESARKWCETAILKNIKMGVDVKTLNKVGYNIPVFDLLLASPNKENSLEGITEYPCLVQEKLDGVRCVYFPKMDVFLGRNGKIIPNIKLKEHFEINTDLILDGELYDSNLKFEEIFGVTSSDDKEVPASFRFVIFNALTQKEWDSQKCETPYINQLQKIKEVIKASKNLTMINSKTARSAEEVMENHAEFIGRGLEGTMVRGIKSLYKWKRVKLNEDVLIKIKQSDMTDGKIIDTYEGENRHQNALGGFVVQLDDGIQVDVGGGLSDDLRKELWTKRDELVDKWIMIKYTEKTSEGSLRFPIFNGFRDSK